MKEYGVSTPTAFIQRQSTKKCFYPLVYSWRYVNGDNFPSGWFSKKYLKSYEINIANLDVKNDINATILITSNNINHDILLSCQSSKIEFIGKGLLLAKKRVNINETIYCGVVVVSDSDNISMPSIVISNRDIESQYIKPYLWNKSTIGTDVNYSKNSNDDIFKPFNEYFF